MQISGGAYSINVVVPEDGFEIKSGKPKSISKTADSGKGITSHFCGDCGTTLFRDGQNFAGMKIIKAGVLDDPSSLDSIAKPAVELFSNHRVGWIAKVDGANDVTNMG
jgi:hypothetical protein